MSGSDQVSIATRFRGPPRSGNGGYVCGVAAQFVDGPAEVTLRAPPPLETNLDVVREGDEVVLRCGAQDIARARPAAALTSTPPPSPGLAASRDAASRYRGLLSHSFPSCFVCGPENDGGLHIYSGAVSDTLSASPWTPGADLADAGGLVAPLFLWAALDCPSYWALPNAGALPAVLGRLSAQIIKRPSPGEALVVIGWPLESQGRKHASGSAIYDSNGVLLAQAEALWIEIKPEQFA